MDSGMRDLKKWVFRGFRNLGKKFITNLSATLTNRIDPAFVE